MTNPRRVRPCFRKNATGKRKSYASLLRPSESMKNGLFENLISQDNALQLIIVENEIPSIDYKEAKLIQFTKNREEGRYGFLNDVYDL